MYGLHQALLHALQCVEQLARFVLAVHMNGTTQIATCHAIRRLDGLLQRRADGAHQQDAGNHGNQRRNNGRHDQHGHSAVVDAFRGSRFSVRNVAVEFDQFLQGGRRLVVELQ